MDEITEARKIGRQIRARRWHGNTPAILWAAGECSLAAEEFSSRCLTALRQEARLSESSFRRLVAIGWDSRLPLMEPLLPSSISTLHEITKLSSKTFDDAIKAGIIHRTVRQAEIKALRKSQDASNKLNPLEREYRSGLVQFSDIAAGMSHRLAIPEDDRILGAQIAEIICWLQTKLHVQMVKCDLMVPQESDQCLCAQIDEILCWLQSRLGVHVTVQQNPQCDFSERG